MSLVDILLVLLIIVTIILCFYLIVSLKKINVTMDLVQKDVHEMSEKLSPILEKLTVVLEKTVKISEEAEQKVMEISESFTNAKNAISNFSLKNIRFSSDNPIGDLIKNLNAVSKGVGSFWKNLKR